MLVCTHALGLSIMAASMHGRGCSQYTWSRESQTTERNQDKCLRVHNQESKAAIPISSKSFPDKNVSACKRPNIVLIWYLPYQNKTALFSIVDSHQNAGSPFLYFCFSSVQGTTTPKKTAFNAYAHYQEQGKAWLLYEKQSVNVLLRFSLRDDTFPENKLL